MESGKSSGKVYAVISSRCYSELIVEYEPDVFVYMIEERYLHELSAIPEINTAAPRMPQEITEKP